MNKKILLPILLLVSSLSFAEIRLPEIVASHMVLQRNTTVQLWGRADKGEKITIDCSWMDEAISAKADKNGDWHIDVTTNNSKAAQSISLKSKSSDILLDDVLFGEVWLCSGQSNMFQPVNGYRGQPTFATLETLKTANNNNLRLFSVEKRGAGEAQDTLMAYKTWQAATPENVATYSAIAYYFGCQLQAFLGVPVGLIHTSWGGSSVQAWMSKEAISQYQDVNLEGRNLKKGTNHIPTVLYNAMINPLIPYTIKGALWYQGESNRKVPDLYRDYFPAMVKDWRSRWGIGDFPFYYVQIAPYYYGGDQDSIYNTYANSAFIREAQQDCLDRIPNAGMAVTMDIGVQFSIHPTKKKEVSERLLYNALNKTYGIKAFKCDGPVYESMVAKDGGLILQFKNAELGLYAQEGLKGFEIAGDDHVFYPAEANIINRYNKVFVKSPKVTHPLAVRYCWRNWTVGTLMDTYLLPASSFRTDDWEDASRSKE